MEYILYYNYNVSNLPPDKVASPTSTYPLDDVDIGCPCDTAATNISVDVLFVRQRSQALSRVRIRRIKITLVFIAYKFLLTHDTCSDPVRTHQRE